MSTFPLDDVFPVDDVFPSDGGAPPPPPPPPPVTTAVLLAQDATRYRVGSRLVVPGLESVMELGEVANLSDPASAATDTGMQPDGRIPGTTRINDLSQLDKIRLTQIDGIYESPEQQESRDKLADRHGERAGKLSYAGRTLGWTGNFESGSIPAVRDLERQLSGLLTEDEQSLVMHVPGEATQYQNVCPDPLVESPAVYWSSSLNTAGGTLSAVTTVPEQISCGQIVLTGATTSGGAFNARPAGPHYGLDTGAVWRQYPWHGQDIWAYGLLKVQAATGTVSELSLQVIQYDAQNTVVTTSLIDSQASPVTSTWYELSGRLDALKMDPRAAGFSVIARMKIGSSSGNYTLRFTRMMISPVSQNFINPCYLDGTLGGFEWDDARPAPSRGPTAVENTITSPFGVGTAAVNASSSGATVNVAPVFSPRSGITTPTVAGARKGAAVSGVYFKATNPDTTSRTLGLTVAQNMLVAGGRLYYAQADLNVLAKPAGALALSIRWIDVGGGFISSTTVASTTATGVSELSGMVLAPAGAVVATMQILITTSTFSALEIVASRFALNDNTEHTTKIVGDEDYALAVVGPDYGARGMIRRPWLIRGVRKVSYSSPEIQASLRARRAFTASLRASDPRIYQIDEHNAQVTLAGAPNFFFATPGYVSTPYTANVPVANVAAAPAGWAYDDAPQNSVWTQVKGMWCLDTYIRATPSLFVLNPSFTTDATNWSTSTGTIARTTAVVYSPPGAGSWTKSGNFTGGEQSYGAATGTFRKGVNYYASARGQQGGAQRSIFSTLFGVPGAIGSVDETITPHPGTSSGATPWTTGVAVWRPNVDRSSGVAVGIQYTQNLSALGNATVYIDDAVIIGGVLPDTARYYLASKVYVTPHVEIVGHPNAAASNAQYFNSINSLQGFKSVGAILKRVSALRYIDVRWNSARNGFNGFTGNEVEVYVNTGSGPIKRLGIDSAKPTLNAQCLLVSEMNASNVVSVWLYTLGVNLLNAQDRQAHLLASGTYTLTAPEIASLGAIVSGNAGIFQSSDGNLQPGGPAPGPGPGPGVSSFSSRETSTPLSAIVPVVGDVDTPMLITLQGGVQDPVLTVNTSTDSTTLALKGTFPNSNPVTIDTAKGAIYDAQGTNRFDVLQSGRMIQFDPGVNTVTVQATGWDANNVHMVCWWRDARR